MNNMQIKVVSLGLLLLSMVSCSNFKARTGYQLSIPNFNKDEWIIDEYPEFDVVWSMYLYHKHKGKHSITILTNKDIELNEKWTKLLSRPDLQMYCKFERNLKPTVIEKDNLYQVSARVICEMGKMKIYMDSVTCNYDLKDRSDLNWNTESATIIKKDGHNFSFNYGCHAHSKTN